MKIFVVAIAAWLVLVSTTALADKNQYKAASEEIAPEEASGHRRVVLAKAKDSMVASAHPLASEAGRQVLRQGGSAVDAAIATQAMLTLVEPQSSGIGGGAFLLYYDAKADRLLAYDGRETAPAKATGDLFLDDNGKPLEFFEAVVGGRSVGTPGVLRMLELAHRQHGRRSWATLFEATIQRAEKGFVVPPRMERLLKTEIHLAKETAARDYFFDEQSRPVAAGSILKNPALARTLRAIANKGADAFYKGPIAADIVAAVQGHENAGLLELSDLANYRPRIREPVSVTYRGYRVCGFPPPTSGGVTTLQILKLLERFDLGEDPHSPRFLHLLAEAERLAYADRGRHIADPDFVAVPTRGLLSTNYLEQRSALIDPKRASTEVRAGQPPGLAAPRKDAKSPEFASTSHVSIVDGEGNIVCMTTTLENAFGSRLMVGGFLLNNQLTDFSFLPTDASGVAIANAVAGGKRPRSSMAPVIVFNSKGAPCLVVGSPGGSRIIGYVAQTLLHVLDFELDIQQAINLPRVVNRNGATEIEDHPNYQESVDRIVEHLGELGHRVILGEQTSGIHAIAISPDGLEGGVDPRRDGAALGD